MLTYYVLGSINSKFVPETITAQSPDSAIKVYLSIHQEHNKEKVFAIGVYDSEQNYKNGEEPLAKWMSPEYYAWESVMHAKYGDLD